MLAILKREISAYFLSPIGYIVLAIFYFFSGIYFFANSIYMNTSSLNSTFENVFMILIIIIAILTMRLFSEEKRQKTDQALLTAPVRLVSMVLGKFFAAIVVFLICISVFLVYALIISSFAAPAWSVIFVNLFGLFLLGITFIAVDMFISSITENQVVAAVGGIAVGIVIIALDFFAKLINFELVDNIVKAISFNQHYKNFTVGILNLSDIIFFLSVSVLFLFLTVRVFEKKRWS